jgi:hypothetical protein
MSSPSTVTTQVDGLADIAKRYLDALADGNFDRVPWSADVVLRSPLQRDRPLEGRCSVEAFFRPMVGHLGPIRFVETYVNQGQDTVIAEAYVGPLHVLDKFVIRSGEIVEQENVFDPRPALEAPARGGMSTDERAMLVEMLEASRDRLRAALCEAPDELWHRKPAGGGWSAAECAEHLVLSEESLLGIIRGRILAGPENPGIAVELRGKDGMVVQAMQNRSTRIRTFEFLEPRGQWAARETVMDAFLARRAVTLDYARTNRDPLHHLAAPLGETGLLDGYQWLLLLAAHTDRHVAQMQEALSGAAAQ